ncbi:uncharacterized protein LOC126780424 [Nymphalis io]|uniref:uncharacterized protein LOC126780424 n=1 Tax=Inachis io TaxID=171585 RepID=UPI002167A3F5|nr:uncharacterized protein LOC126780424 [Nymphalis io]
MSNNDEQNNEKAGGAEPSSSPPHLSDPNIISKALIAKLIDKSDGPMQLRMKRKSRTNKNISGQHTIIQISDDDSTSSGQSSPAPNAPKPFEKSNVLYERKCVKKYKQEKEDWWRDDDDERDQRLPRTDTNTKN